MPKSISPAEPSSPFASTRVRSSRWSRPRAGGSACERFESIASVFLTAPTPIPPRSTDWSMRRWRTVASTTMTRPTSCPRRWPRTRSRGWPRRHWAASSRSGRSTSRSRWSGARPRSIRASAASATRCTAMAPATSRSTTRAGYRRLSSAPSPTACWRRLRNRIRRCSRVSPSPTAAIWRSWTWPASCRRRSKTPPGCWGPSRCRRRSCRWCCTRTPPR